MEGVADWEVTSAVKRKTQWLDRKRRGGYQANFYIFYMMIYRVLTSSLGRGLRYTINGGGGGCRKVL